MVSSISIFVVMLSLCLNVSLQTRDIHMKRITQDELEEHNSFYNPSINLFSHLHLDVETEDDFQKLYEQNYSLCKVINIRIHLNLFKKVTLPIMDALLTTAYIHLDQEVTFLPYGLFSTFHVLDKLHIYPFEDGKKKFVQKDNTTTVDLQTQNIRDFVLKSDTFEGLASLKELTISRVGLQIIETDGLVGLTELSILILSQNQISRFSSKLLKKCCKRLKELMLESNKLVNVSFEEHSSIPMRRHRHAAHHFPDDNKMFSLEVLTLQNNAIKRINKKTFGNAMPNLKELNLGYNRIDYIDPLSFIGLSSLETLILESNLLTILHRTIFVGLKNLISLDLNSNYIKSVESKTFEEMTSLETLKLSGNNLTFIEPGTFDGLNNLRTLDLSKNKLKIIDFGLFRGLRSLSTQEHTKLRHLDLKNNRITVIIKDSLKGLHNLVELLLDHNELAVFDPSDAGLQKVPIKVSLHHNPWYCTCYNLPLVLWLNSINLTDAELSDETVYDGDQYNGVSRAICTEPKDLANIEIINLLSYISKDCDVSTHFPKSTSVKDSTSLIYVQSPYYVLLLLLAIYSTFT